MRQITCKSTVRVKQITPALVYMLMALQTMLDHPDCPSDGLVITSINDSTHAPTSRHYTGEAFDLRTHNFRDLDAVHQFAQDYEDLLTSAFTVLLESEGTQNEHIHVQVKKGSAFRFIEPDWQKAVFEIGDHL